MTEHVSPVKKRGRESVLDMFRSLGLVLIIVIVVWWLAKPNAEDEKKIRVVDPGPSIAALLREAPGTPVPTALPAGWQPTVTDGDADTLRLGYVVPGNQYVEYAVSLAGSPQFLADLTGNGTEVGTFDVDGVSWRQLSGKGQAISLVRTVGSRTVVVGGVRETAKLSDLRTLAAVVKP